VGIVSEKELGCRDEEVQQGKHVTRRHPQFVGKGVGFG
jgi:hypothetical protein